MGLEFLLGGILSYHADFFLKKAQNDEKLRFSLRLLHTKCVPKGESDRTKTLQSDCRWSAIRFVEIDG